MKMQTLRHFLLCAILFSYTALTHAAEQIGKAAAVRGSVTATGEDGTVRQLKSRAPVFEHDFIETGKRGRIQLSFKDRTLITLGPETTMKITEYSFDKEGGTGSMNTKIEKGVFRVMGGLITKMAPEKFKTETPTATIGIRGSFYMGNETGNQLKLAFLGGKGIYVKTDKGTLDLNVPNQGAEVNAGEKPQRKDFSSDDLQDMNNKLDGDTGEEDEDDGDQGAQKDQPDENGEDDQPADEEGAANDTPDEGDVEVTDNDDPILGDEGSGGKLDTPSTPISNNPEITLDPVTPDPKDEIKSKIEETVFPTISGSYHGSKKVKDQNGNITEVTKWKTGPYQLNVDNDSGTVFGTFGADPALGSTGGVLERSFPEGNISTASAPTTFTQVNITDPNTSWETVQTNVTFPGNTTPTPVTTKYLLDKQDPEFMVYMSDYPAGGYYDFGFAGKPTDQALAANPSGIMIYSGLGFERSDEAYPGGDPDPIEPINFKTIVNFNNKKVVGIELPDPNDPGHHETPYFYFGNVTNNKLNTKYVESDLFLYDEQHNFNPEFEVFSGNGTGTFYGSDWQGLGITGVGTSTDFINPETTNWDYIGAQMLSNSKTAQSWVGDKTFKGFTGGIAWNMQNGTPVGTRTLFSNAPMTLNLNIGSGTATGSMPLFNYSGNQIENLTLGAGGNSALIGSDLFVTEISGLTAKSAYTQSFLYHLKTPAASSTPWATWGSWFMTLDDAQQNSFSGFTGHTTLWVAAENYIGDITSVPTNVIGYYEGNARAIVAGKDNTSNHYNDYFSGNLQLTLDFGSKLFDGEINLTSEFDSNYQLTLQLKGGVTASGFTGTVNTVEANNSIKYTQGDTGYQSSVNGAFYDDPATTANDAPDRMAGNFNTTFDDGTSYESISGVFAATEQPVSGTQISGKYSAVVSSQDTLNSTASSTLWSGTTSGVVQSSDKTVDTNIVAADLPAANTWIHSMNSIDPSSNSAPATYTDTFAAENPQNWSEEFTPMDIPGIGATAANTHFLFDTQDPEFMMFYSEHMVSQGSTDIYFDDFGYAGLHSSGSPPTGQVVQYAGNLYARDLISLPFGPLPADNEPFRIFVNFTNGAILGLGMPDPYATDPEEGWFFTGNLTTGATDAAISFIEYNDTDFGTIDSDPYNDLASVLSGSGLLAFFGSSWQGIGLTMSGTEANMLNLSQTNDWDAIGALLRSDSNFSAPPGNMSLTGFGIGITENMSVTTPGMSRTLLTTTASPLSLTLNGLTGNITGGMSLTNVEKLRLNSTAGELSLNGLSFGGLNAYINENFFVTGINGVSSTVFSAGNSGPLYNTPSYLINRGGTIDIAGTPKTPFPDMGWLTWGTWKTAFLDPASGDIFEVFDPTSIWLAAPNQVGSLNLLTTAKGVYTGNSYITKTSFSGTPYTQHYLGTSELTLDFGSKSFIGRLDLDSGNLVLNLSGKVSDTGFDGFVSTIYEFGSTAPSYNDADNTSVSSVQGGLYHSTTGFDHTLQSAPDRILGIVSAESIDPNTGSKTIQFSGGFGAEAVGTLPTFMSGKYLAASTEYDSVNTTSTTTYWNGNISGAGSPSFMGTIGLENKNDSSQKWQRTLVLDVNKANSDSTYTERDELNNFINWPKIDNVNDSPDFGTLSVTDSYMFDKGSAEFMTFDSFSYDTITNSDRTFSGFGYAGIEADVTNRPSSGIATFIGPGMVRENENDFDPNVQAGVELVVNYATGKILGFTIGHPNSTGEEFTKHWIIKGQLDLSSIPTATLSALGSTLYDFTGGAFDDPSGVTATGNATFYGTGWQGVGLNLGGMWDALSIDSGMTSGFDLIASGYRAEIVSPVNTGTVTKHLMMAGVAEDIQGPYGPNTKTFFNTVPGTLTINYDTGDVSGNLGALEGYTSFPSIDNLSLSGTVIDSELMLVEITSATVTDGTNGTLQAGQPHYLLQEGDELFDGTNMITPLPSWVSWGPWNASYEDPTSADPANPVINHIHSPGTWWLAAENLVTDLSTVTVTGTYSGGAIATHLQDGFNPEILTGTSDLTVDFSSKNFSGNLNFGSGLYELSLNGSVGASGITGEVTSIMANNGADFVMSGTDPNTNTSVQGNFYDDPTTTGNTAPDRVMGTFNAEQLDGSGNRVEQFIGGFGADLQP